MRRRAAMDKVTRRSSGEILSAFPERNGQKRRGKPPPYKVLLTMLVSQTAPSSAPVCALGHLPPGEGILTPNPPAQNRRPVINVICNSTHVTIPDINITWESNPTHGPARCQYYVPICSGTGSVTPAFCAAKKSIFNFQTQSRAAPRISPAAPSEIKWTARPGGRAIQSISQRVGGHMGPSLRLKRTTLITGSAPLIRLAFGPPFPFWPSAISP